MSGRIVCYYLQFLNCCARRQVCNRPLTQSRTIYALTQQKLTPITTGCWGVTRSHTWLSKNTPKAECGQRNFSSGTSGEESDNKEANVSETQSNLPNTGDTIDSNHNSWDCDEVFDHETNVGELGVRERSSVPQSIEAGDSSTKQGTLDLSSLTWSSDGIVIHPKVHFGRDSKVEKPDMTTWKNVPVATKGRMKEYDIQGLLHNIQKSRAKKKEVVVKDRKGAVMNIEELVEFLREQNARDVVVIELPPGVDYVRYFVVCSGMGSRHIGRMADSIVAEVRHSRS